MNHRLHGLVLIFIGHLLCGCGSAKEHSIAVQDMRQIKMGLAIYQMDYGAFPSTSDGLQLLIVKVQGTGIRGPHVYGPYLDSPVPTDSWGHSYVYHNPGVNGAAYDLLSCGPDGKEGDGDDIR
ncbi:hypothetical protein BH10PLA1_BH10PLA1_16850 [soil metagenome]